MRYIISKIAVLRREFYLKRSEIRLIMHKLGITKNACETNRKNLIDCHKSAAMFRLMNNKDRVKATQRLAKKVFQ